jgi:hypothetical protein
MSPVRNAASLIWPAALEAQGLRLQSGCRCDQRRGAIFPLSQYRR